MCTEALVKLAFGIVAASAKAQIEVAAGPYQFGAGRPAGAEYEIAEIRACLTNRPTTTLVSLDVKNAFGSVQWHQALELLLSSAPKLAPPLAALWSSGHTDIYTTQENGAWESFSITGSLVQGNAEAHLICCLLMATTMRLAYHDPQVTQEARAAWWYWIYVGSCISQAPPPDLIPIFRAIYTSLANFNLRLQPHKRAARHPAHLGLDPTPCLMPFLTAAWGDAGTITYDPDGFTILGTEPCAGRATSLHTTGTQAARQVAQRAEEATTLAATVRDMLHHTPPAGAYQPTWTMLTSIVGHSPTYDSRALPCSLVLPHARAVEEAILQTIHAILGTGPATLLPHHIAQLSLPTKFAGLEVYMPTCTCILARTASLVEHGPSLRAAIRARDPAADATTMDGVTAALAEGLAVHLAHPGIHGLGAGGAPTHPATRFSPRRPAPPARSPPTPAVTCPAPRRHCYSLIPPRCPTFPRRHPHPQRRRTNRWHHAHGTSTIRWSTLPGRAFQIHAPLEARHQRAARLLQKLECFPQATQRSASCPRPCSTLPLRAHQESPPQNPPRHRV